MLRCSPDARAERRRRWRILRSAIRSSIRRYPRELIASFQQRDRGHTPSDNCLRHITKCRLAAAWLGHGSVLARVGGLNVMIDPVFSHRIGKRLGRLTLGPKRLQAPPISPGGLPKIDVILITHAHFDHLDCPTLEQLASRETTVVTSQRTRRLIPRGFGHIHELSPGRMIRVGDLKIRAMSPAHWGARNVIDQHRKPNSYLVESEAGRVFFGGDTAHTDAFGHLNAVDLAVFGIGAYDPWEHMHATPEQVWSMFLGMDAKWLLPIHHSTFCLSDEPLDEPMRRLLAVASGYTDRIVRVEQGDLWVAPRRHHHPAHHAMPRVG